LQRGECLVSRIDRGDLGAILREDARYDLLHVGLVVDDQHPDAIETRATVERNYATRHAVMSSRFRLKSAGALPSKVWSLLLHGQASGTLTSPTPWASDRRNRRRTLWHLA
jgi:hypothetical protein